MATKKAPVGLSVKLDAPHLTKSGKIDRRYKLSGTVTSKNLRRMIQSEVATVIGDLDSLFGLGKSDNVKSRPSHRSNEKRKGSVWRTSIMGVSIIARNAVSTGSHLWNDIASTDSVALQKSLVNGSVGLTISAIGTFGGPWGAVAASVMSTIWSVVGNKVNNSIQRSGDKQRAVYNFQNYDAYKYGTYCYSSNSGEWTADDAVKVQKRVIGKKVSV